MRLLLPHPGKPADLLCHLEHLRAGLEKPLSVAPGSSRTEVPQLGRTEWNQSSRCVQDVNGRRILADGIADGVGEHRAQPHLTGHLRHPGGMGRGARPPLHLP
jgi:hypothetical protein